MTLLIQRQLTTLSLRLGTAGLGFVIKQVLNIGRSGAPASAVNDIYDLWWTCGHILGIYSSPGWQTMISRWVRISSCQSHLLPSYPWELEALSWLVVAQASDSIRDFGKLLCLVPRTRQCAVLNDSDSYLNTSED